MMPNMLGSHPTRVPSIPKEFHRLIRCNSCAATTSPLFNDPFSHVLPGRGFLPCADPLPRLGTPGAAAWEAALADVPKLVVAGGPNGMLRKSLASLPPFPLQQLLTCEQQPPGTPLGDTGASLDGAQVWRAYYLLSFLAHAYMWCEPGLTPTSLPSVIAQPWVRVSQTLGMPPVLVYATYNLLNWRRLQASQPVELGNIVCLQNFMASTDEEWFRLVHVDIEAKAAVAVDALEPLMHAAADQRDTQLMVQLLEKITSVLQQMQAVLSRMGEKCDPYIYYTRVRQPMSGWRNNPALPQGLLYEGVQDSAGQPLRLQLYGETGAQSSILPALDIVLGIEHKEAWLKTYLDDMRAHMPPAHRTYLSHLTHVSQGSVRRVCKQAGPGQLRDAYNEAVTELEKFRSQHKAFAYTYIRKLSQQEEKGTGGSDFMPALQGYRDTTHHHLLL